MIYLSFPLKKNWYIEQSNIKKVIIIKSVFDSNFKKRF